eukprot:9011160-Pyramimonas_sp.AAC.1
MPRGVASIREFGSTQRKGPPVEAFWSVLGASWRPRRPLGASWVPRRASWGLLGVPWGPLGGLFGRLLRPPGASWAPLEALLKRSWEL